MRWVVFWPSLHRVSQWEGFLRLMELPFQRVVWFDYRHLYMPVVQVGAAVEAKKGPRRPLNEPCRTWNTPRRP